MATPEPPIGFVSSAAPRHPDRRMHQPAIVGMQPHKQLVRDVVPFGGQANKIVCGI